MLVQVWLPFTHDGLIAHRTAKSNKAIAPWTGTVINSVAVVIQHPESVHVNADLTSAASVPIRHQRNLAQVAPEAVKLILARGYSIVSSVIVAIQNPESAAEDADLRFAITGPIACYRFVSHSVGEVGEIFIRRCKRAIAIIIKRPLTLIKVTDLSPMISVPIAYNRDFARSVATEDVISVPIRACSIKRSVAIRIERPVTVVVKADLCFSVAVPVTYNRNIR